MIVKTEGIVLKTRDFRETSKLTTFFTRSHGKMTGVLKGIRKDLKKFGSNVDKFSINDIIYYEYKRSAIHLVSQCDLKQFFFPVREDYQRSIAANYALELIDVVMPLEQQNQRVYHALIKFLESLETIKDIEKLIFVFQIKILHLSGFSPHLDSCVRCGEKIKGKARFSMSMGGLVCQTCLVRETTFLLISKGTIASIMHIERNEWDNALRLGLTKKSRRELRYILDNFLVYHLERRLKSARFLQSSFTGLN